MTTIDRIALAVAFVAVTTVGILAIAWGDRVMAGVFCVALVLLWQAEPW